MLIYTEALIFKKLVSASTNMFGDLIYKRVASKDTNIYKSTNTYGGTNIRRSANI